MQNNEKDIIDFAENITGKTFNRVEEDLGFGYVRLNSSEAEKRQAKHDIRWVEDIVVELLRNSRDSRAKNILVSSKKDLHGNRQIIVIDDGSGIPADLRERVFEPRVTSKLNSMVIDSYGVHGRGMALYSISSNTLVSTVHYSELNKGTVVYNEINTHELPERKDQSTFPTITTKNGRKRIIKGPKNILRAVAEFSLDNAGISVYCGSPSQIVATLCSLDRANSEDKIWKGLGQISNAFKFRMEVEKRLNIKLSERNNHRVMIGEVVPLLPIISPVKRESNLTSVADNSKEFARNKIKIPTPVLKRVLTSFEETFNKEAASCFLKSTGDAKISFSEGKLKITIGVSRDSDGYND